MSKLHACPDVWRISVILTYMAEMEQEEIIVYTILGVKEEGFVINRDIISFWQNQPEFNDWLSVRQCLQKFGTF